MNAKNKMPDAVKAAWAELKSASALSRRDGWFDTSTHQDKAADDLKSWVRNSAQPARMTEELDAVLEYAGDYCDGIEQKAWTSKNEAHHCRACIAAVRQQAAQPVRLDKVREALCLLLWKIDNGEQTRSIGHYAGMLTEALAELDAAEGWK